MKPKYYTVEELINKIDESNRSICRRILSDNRRLFQTVQGSTHNHQAWPGGYFDHVQEVMNLAVIFYEALNSARPLPFSLSDGILIVFLHDIEKPWAFEVGPDGRLQRVESLRAKPDQHQFRKKKLEEYGMALTPEQENAIKYVEGEHNDYTNKRRVMGPLAAFCHLCDVWSARGWFDYPLEENDPWNGAGRFRE